MGGGCMDASTLTEIAYFMGACFWFLFAICAVFGLLWSFEEVAVERDEEVDDIG